MPTYRRRSRKTTSKRRYSRKRIYKSRRKYRSTAEGMYTEKVKYRLFFKTGDVPNALGYYPQQYQFSWMNAYNAVGNNTYSINNGNDNGQGTDQLVNVANMFKYCKIVGLKLKYIPINTGETQVLPIEVGTVAPTNFNQAPNDFFDYAKYWRNSRDIKVFDPQKVFKRYYRVSKVYKYRVAPAWVTTEAMATGQIQEVPDFVTCVTSATSLKNTMIGYIDVSWYLKCKDRISNKLQIS